MSTYIYDAVSLKNLLSLRNIYTYTQSIKNYFLKIKSYKKISKISKTNNIGNDILICKEKYLDHQKFTSRKVINVDSIDICIFKNILVGVDDEIGFGVFLKKEAINYPDILINGYYQYKNKKIQFSKIIEKKVLKELFKPTYWIDIVLDIPDSLINNKISIFIDNINISKNEKLFLSNNILYKHKPKKPKLILILSLDAVSDIDIKDYQDNLFPTFKKLEDEGFIKFNNAISSSTVTASSAASLLAGVPLSKHKMFDYDEWYFSDKLKKISPKLKLISEMLSEQDYYTSAVTTFSKWRPHSGFSRGFNEYLNFCSGALHNSSYKSKVFEVLSKAKNYNVFALFHLPGAHPPYIAKINNYTNNNLKNVYLETLKSNDDLIGQIISYLKEMNIFDDSLIYITSDHGRGIDGYSRYGYQFKDERLRVPLYIKEPYNINLNKENYVSANTFIYDMILNNFNTKNNDYINKNNYDGINWLSETFNYKTKKHIGFVGYGYGLKFVVEINFNKYTDVFYEIDSIVILNLDDNIVENSKYLEICRISILKYLESNNYDNKTYIQSKDAYILES